MFGRLFEIAPAPPDGWKAFVVACCGCLVQTVDFGLSNCFGTFSNSLHQDERLGYPSLTQVAIVGSFATGIGPILGLFSGLAVTKLGSRVTLLFASICFTLSMILPALLANSVVTLGLTYSLFVALGGFIISTAATATSTWFVKRKALGMGINFSGGGLGSLTIPYIAGVLQSKYDWRTCFFILSSLTAISITCSLFVCLRTEPKIEAPELERNEEMESEDEKEEGSKEANETHKHNPLVTSNAPEEDRTITDWRVARHERLFTPKEFFHHIVLTKDFIVLFLILSLYSIAIFSTVYCAVPYALSMGKEGTIYSDAPIVPIARAVTVFLAFGSARIVGGPSLGYIASVYVGDKAVCTFSLGIYSITLFVWIACRELWQHIIVMGLMGICMAGFFATYPAIIGHKFHGPNLPSVMGIEFAAAAVGGFIGGPLSTALAEANNGDYTVAFIVVAVMCSLATIFVFFGIDCDKVPCVCGRKDNNNEDHEVGKQSHIIGNSESSENEPISS